MRSLRDAERLMAMQGWKKEKTLSIKDLVEVLRFKVWRIRKMYCALHNCNVGRLLLIGSVVANDDSMLLKSLGQVQKYQGASVIVEE